MKRSEIYEIAIMSVIDSSLDATEMIEVLDTLFEDRRFAKSCESRKENGNAAP